MVDNPYRVAKDWPTVEERFASKGTYKYKQLRRAATASNLV